MQIPQTGPYVSTNNKNPFLLIHARFLKLQFCQGDRLNQLIEFSNLYKKLMECGWGDTAKQRFKIAEMRFNCMKHFVFEVEPFKGSKKYFQARQLLKDLVAGEFIIQESKTINEETFFSTHRNIRFENFFIEFAEEIDKLQQKTYLTSREKEYLAMFNTTLECKAIVTDRWAPLRKIF